MPAFSLPATIENIADGSMLDTMISFEASDDNDATSKSVKFLTDSHKVMFHSVLPPMQM